MRCLLTVLVVVSAASAAAQIQNRPTDPPVVTAERESWYQLGEPLQFAGDVYYRAGAQVFFNGNAMVRTGHYNGVPLYADTTLEPYSIVYVPIGGGRMQPYERLRQGALASTSGSRTPSFPVRVAPGGALIPNAPIAPTALPQPIGAISTFTIDSGTFPGRSPAAAPVSEPVVMTAPPPLTAVPLAAPRPADPSIPRVRIAGPDVQPKGDGIFLMYRGQKWISAGPAVVLTAAGFEKTGEYAGFPVYTRRGGPPDTIYVPSTANQVAPYRLQR
jgi:hypothetical protein